MSRRGRVSIALLAAGTGLLLLVLPGVAHATNYVVNSIAEPGTGACDASECTLREAVDALSSNGDTISFDFTGTGLSAPFEIELDAMLDVDQNQTTIDALNCTGCGTVRGTTSGAADGFDSVLAVRVIASTSWSGDDSLFFLDANDVTVRGFNIDGSPEFGIEIEGDRVIVEDCFIGTSITGGLGLGNDDDGINLHGGSDVNLGPGLLISGNGDNGISISDPDSDRPTIVGNIIGLDIASTANLGNTDYGIIINGEDGTLSSPDIGGSTAALGNVISGNGLSGVLIYNGVDGDDAPISNNLIGTDGGGTVAIPNGDFGILFFADFYRSVRPQEFQVDDNVISGNTSSGIYVHRARTMSWERNAIGTDASGTIDLGNGGDGVTMYSNSNGVVDTASITIGGVGNENLIAYNSGDGIHLNDGGSREVELITIRANSFWDNVGLAVDILNDNVSPDGDGPTLPPANTCTNNEGWGNREASRPLISSAEVLGGTLTVSGTSCASADLDLYFADPDTTGYGEPATYLGTTTATGGGTGTWTVTVPASGATSNDVVTALQTDTNGETGEAALNMAISAPCDADADGQDANTGGQCVGTDCDDTNPLIYLGATEICDGLDGDCDGSLPTDEADSDSDGESTCEGDCDDGDATVNTGESEICDGLDNDCDGLIPADETDDDGDGFNECADGDCDDGNPAISPTATEVCNGIDDDCDGALPLDEIDGDGDSVLVCAGDCNDGDDTVFPGAVEACNGVDDDCSGSVDATETDDDGDGESECAGDCNDTAITIFSTAPELCDGLDNDCDGLIPADETDDDGDGFNECADGDCDDGNPAISPTATEVCNGIDDDCDGALPLDETDGDADGESTCAGDCNDANGTVNTGAAELCDGLDTDCDGALPSDELDADNDGQNSCEGDCDDLNASINSSALEVCDGVDSDCDGLVPSDETDDDGDGFDECADGDCDDTDITIYVGASESCNLLDDDCDGLVDEDFDADGDGFPDGTVDCIASWGAAGVDCDDADAAVSPGAVEQCDGIDNNCDGVVDEDADNDGDGFTNCAGDCDDADATIYPGATEVCDLADTDCDGTLPADESDIDGDGVAACLGDCDDADDTVFPGAPELCDEVDNDCDGAVPVDESDDDGDSFFECDGGDCDDSDPLTYLGAVEQCDGLDNDCDGVIPGDETDDDLDGFNECDDGDCDDTDLTINPAAEEVCDAIDQDCDGVIDNGFDIDEDGVTTCGEDGVLTTEDDDCDDENELVSPDLQEVCDGIDNDCDGLVDEVEDLDGDGFTNCDGDCNDENDQVFPGAEEVCDGEDSDCDGKVPTDETDDDEDGANECADGDCDDTDGSINPDAEEVCDDGIDQDCDGEDSVCGEDCFDLDLDGVTDCDGDCDDEDAQVSPVAWEICGDGIDQDCDGDDIDCIEVSLGAVGGCDCGGGVGGTTALALLGFLMFGGFRRRRLSV